MVQRRMIILTIVVITFFGLVDAAWLPNSRIVMGHDNYVELAKAGLLLTFGFLAAKVTMKRLSGDNSRVAHGVRHAAGSVLMITRFAVLFIPLGFVGSVYMYLASAAGQPLLDLELARYDAMLGFDWQAFLAFFNDRPWAAAVLFTTYHSVAPQILLLIFFLSATHREDRLFEFAALLAVTSLLTAIAMVLVPAAGAYVHFSPPADAFASFTPRAGVWHFDELVKLRSGEPFVFSSTKSQGLVTFPSYHTALGIVITYALRGMPLLFPLIAVTNALMIVATLPEGGHYLVDVLAGAMIGVVSVMLVRFTVTMHYPSSVPARLGRGLWPRGSRAPAANGIT